MQILGPRSLNRSLNRNLLGKGLFDSASLDLRFAVNKTLDPRVTFTRASTGTYVGGDGALKTAVTNLVLRSEEFDNTAAWSLNATTVTANSLMSPAGTTTADTLFEDAVTASHGLLDISASITSGATYTFSLYAKANTATVVQLLGRSAGFGVNVWANFNLSDGTVGTVGTSTTASIQPAANGWYRCSVTGAATGTATGGFAIGLTGNDANSLRFPSYAGNTATGLYIWGAQLEQASTAGEYVPTTSTINSAPRFTHDPTTGESLGLLVEEARTNLVLRSEDFSTSWPVTNATVSTNNAIAPNGNLIADSLIETSATALHYTQQIVNPVTSGASYLLSVYAKANTRSSIELLDPYALVGRTFNLSNGTTSASQTGAGAPASFAIQPVGDGWYRCSIGVTASGTSIALRITISNGSATSYPGDGTSGIYLWGAQLEAGAFPTSYIPTTSATVTRAADVATITGTNFSSWYNQTEGTVYGAFKRISYTGASTVVSINDNTTNNRSYNFRQDSATTLTVLSATGGTTYAASVLTLSSSTLTDQVAAAQKLNDSSASANGATVVTDSTVLMPTVTQAQIGNVTSLSYFNGTIKRLTFWPIRLPNATLQAITTS